MNRYLFIAIILFGIFLPLDGGAQIPINPNQTDAQGKRQGKWTILFDKEGKVIEDTSRVDFYRLITYKDSNPIGPVHYYFRNGNPKASFERMIIENQREIFDGTATWYNNNGFKEAEAVYTNGQRTGEVKIFFTDGSLIAEAWNNLNQKGLEQDNQGQYNQALPFFEKGKIRALYEFGKNHINYAASLDNLATSFRYLKNYRKAELLYLESLELRAKVQGKDHIDYASSLNNLALVYKAIGKYSSAEPLYLAVLEIRAKVLVQS